MEFLHSPFSSLSLSLSPSFQPSSSLIPQAPSTTSSTTSPRAPRSRPTACRCPSTTLDDFSFFLFLVEEKEKGFFSSKNKKETERTEREKVMATRPLPFFCRDVLFSSTTTCDKQRQKKREEEEEETEREKEKLFLVGRGEGMKLFFCFDGREKQKKRCF